METLYTPPTYVMAEIGDRLVAVLIDSAVYFLPAVLLAGGFFVSRGDFGAASALFLAVGGLAFLGVLIYQIILLTTLGQTVGKRAMKIKIVRVSDQQNGGFVSNVLLRGFVNGLICYIPLLGGLYALADMLFIFGSERRCLHDFIAGTIVVKPSDEV